MKLIHISRTGLPGEDIPDLPDAAKEVGAAYVGLYTQVGFVPPWLGYFALDGSDCIGTCGFKSPPVAGRVEIAYFTFPGFEGRGYATRMAEALIERGRMADMNAIIAAQTLPQESASTAILRRLGFTLVGTIDHPEDGQVWEWQLPNNTVQATHANART
jgi:[ribosomal protein S5]-alanine N-acetyltransferase